MNQQWYVDVGKQVFETQDLDKKGKPKKYSREHKALYIVDQSPITGSGVLKITRSVRREKLKERDEEGKHKFREKVHYTVSELEGNKQWIFHGIQAPEVFAFPTTMNALMALVQDNKDYNKQAREAKRAEWALPWKRTDTIPEKDMENWLLPRIGKRNAYEALVQLISQGSNHV